MKKDMFTLSRGLAMGRSLLRATSHEPPKAQIEGAEWMSTDYRLSDLGLIANLLLWSKYESEMSTVFPKVNFT